MSINIKFLLPNQELITIEQFDKSISINQIFEDIHFSHDIFDQENFHLEWSVFSTATNRYLGYETLTLEEIFPDQEEDTFIFVDSMITGLKLSNWFKRVTQNNNEMVNFNDEQTHELNNQVLEGCVSYTCEDYHKSIDQYLSALDINLYNEESILGIGGCLINLSCSQSAIQIYDLLIRINPKNALAHMNKGKALNRLKQYNQAQESLDTAIRLNPKLQSVYNQEKSIAQQQQQLQFQKQNLQQEK